MRLIPDYLQKIPTAVNTIYRGHSDASWELKPSIGRHYNGTWAKVAAHENKALDEFVKKSVPYIKHRPSTKIEWLCLMQHHGCATRLLDFTTNPLIALFFASDLSVKSDGEFIIANYEQTYEHVEDEKLFNHEKSFVYHPPHITERIIGQSGCFVCFNTPNKPLNAKQIKRINIPAKDKYYIHEELLSLGINYSSLFPGVDGLCRDLNEALTSELQWDEILS